jgi:arsenate reductase-like glutaredoxin family protein
MKTTDLSHRIREVLLVWSILDNWDGQSVEEGKSLADTSESNTFDHLKKKGKKRKELGRVSLSEPELELDESAHLLMRDSELLSRPKKRSHH